MLQPRGDARAAISRAQLWRAHELHRYNRGSVQQGWRGGLRTERPWM